MSSTEDADEEDVYALVRRLQRLLVRLERIWEQEEPAEVDERWLRGRVLAGLSVTALAGLTVSDPALDRPRYRDRYVWEGPPDLSPVAVFADDVSFPPLLTIEPSDEEPAVRPSVLDVSDEQIAEARVALLADPGVLRALGDRYVEVASGLDIPLKHDGVEQDGRTGIGFEFYSYSRGQALRAAVVEGRVDAVEQLAPEYQPEEADVEIERAVALITADQRYAKLVRGTEPEALLTVPEDGDSTDRHLFVQFVTEENRIMLGAVVDLTHERIVAVDTDPDAPGEGEDEEEHA